MKQQRDGEIVKGTEEIEPSVIIIEETKEEEVKSNVIFDTISTYFPKGMDKLLDRPNGVEIWSYLTSIYWVVYSRVLGKKDRTIETMLKYAKGKIKIGDSERQKQIIEINKEIEKMIRNKNKRKKYDAYIEHLLYNLLFYSNQEIRKQWVRVSQNANAARNKEKTSLKEYVISYYEREKNKANEQNRKLTINGFLNAHLENIAEYCEREFPDFVEKLKEEESFLTESSKFYTRIFNIIAKRKK